jgi:hypothetical protein
MPSEIPSLAALESNEDGPLLAELRMVRLRSQAAVLRALADHVEQLSRAVDAGGLCLQIIEEMARLGRRLLEATGDTHSRKVVRHVIVPVVSDAELLRQPHEVGQRAGPHLAHHLAAMDLDRDLADPELGGDLLVEEPPHDPLHHFPFACRQ